MQAQTEDQFVQLMTSALKGPNPQLAVTESNGVLFVKATPLPWRKYTTVSVWTEDNLIRVEIMDDNGASYGEAQFDGFAEASVARFVTGLVVA